MRAAETTLRQMLEGGKLYIVPLFQRPYSWDKKNWITLWEDIGILYCAFVNSGGNQIPFQHFLGPVVTVAQPGTADSLSPYLVIDGQQRLTTLSLLLAALRDYAREIEWPGSLAEEVNDYLVNRYAQNPQDRLKVIPTQADWEVYNRIVAHEASKDDLQSRVGKAYTFFKESLRRGLVNEEEIEPLDLDLNKLKSVLMEGLSLVHITLSDQDNPYLIFESLNYKGEPLTQADLVRNYLLMQVPSDDKKRVYHELWLPVQKKFEELFGGNKYLDRMTEVFWHYLRKDGREVVWREVYQGIRERYQHLSRSAESPKSAEDFTKELMRYATYYLRFRVPEEEPEPRLAHWWKRFATLEFTTLYPFLFNLYHDLEEERIDYNTLEEILSVIESYYVRRMLAQVPTNSLNKVFSSLYSNLDLSKPVDSLKDILMSFSGPRRWPDDQEVEQAILSRVLYDPNKVKFVLERIEEHLRKKLKLKEAPDTTELTVEHIMPQTLTDEWRNMLGPDAEEIHKRLLHTLGNLTLTGYNPELSNRPFSEKLVFYKKSTLAINKEYFEGRFQGTVWDEDAIQERACWLAKLACEVWPR